MYNRTIVNTNTKSLTTAVLMQSSYCQNKTIGQEIRLHAAQFRGEGTYCDFDYIRGIRRRPSTIYLQRWREIFTATNLKTMAKCLTVVTRWLVTQDSVWYQREQKSSSHCAINASVVDGITWKSSGIAVQLNVNCYYYIFTYYLLTSLLTYLPIYLLTSLLTYLFTYLLSSLLTYLPIWERLRWSRGSVLAGSNPAEAVGFFQGEKILSTPSFGREVKPFVPCRIFTACKISLNVMWKSSIFRQNLSAVSRPSSSSFHY